MNLQLSDKDSQLAWVRCVWDILRNRKGEGFVKRIAYGIPAFEVTDGIYQVHDPLANPTRYGLLVRDGKSSRFSEKLMSKVYVDVTGRPLSYGSSHPCASVSTGSITHRLEVFNEPITCPSCERLVSITYLPESVCAACKGV